MTLRSLSILIPTGLLALQALGCAEEGDTTGAVADSGTETGSSGEGSGSGDGDGDGDGDSSGDGDGEPAYDCSDVQQGLSTISVDGVPRQFYLDLPDGADANGPWPVVFNWHGLGDTASNMRGLVAPHVNDPNFPFIGVTPEDTDMELVVPILGAQNFDWDVFDVVGGSIEADLFDAVLACADQLYGVDDQHIHSMGFSLGSILSDMLGTIRGEQIASLATYSGGYWSNPQNIDGLLSQVVTWPPHLTTNKYPQLFVHGGPTDTFGVAGVIELDFSIYAANDLVFLNGKGHDAVICPHTGGHTVPSSMPAPTFLQFFKDHPLGTVDSPYSQGLPASFASTCSFSPKN